MHRAAVLGGCLALMTKVALAAPGDRLAVSGDRVNVRTGPGTEYRVSLQIHRGQPAVELARDGEWVQVELTDPAAQGWIHRSLLGLISRAQPADAAGAVEASSARPEAASPLESAAGAQRYKPSALPSLERSRTGPAFENEALARFRSEVQEFNARAQALAGVDLFTGAEPAGNGTVQVLVTEAWHLVPAAGQESYANALFSHWQALATGAEPLRLQVVDPSGTVVSEKSGPASP
jgi:Bacterial SH3 domain